MHVPHVVIRQVVFFSFHWHSFIFTQLEDEPHLKYQCMFAMDANFSLKRMAAGNRQEGDTRVFNESDYYLQQEEVERYANEVTSSKNTGPAVKPGTSGPDVDVSDDEYDNQEQGDPTDGDTADVSGCTIRWKAAASDEKKKMWAIFEESGLFASACRHGIMMWIIDIIRSGEL